MSTPKKPFMAILAAALVFVFFAGCLTDDGSPDGGNDGGDGDGQNETATPTTTTSPSPTGTSPTPTGPVNGSAPVADLTANATNGTTPANITFNLSAEEADGDDLEWTFDWDGDGTPDETGTTLPATFNVTYEAAGNYTANLTVTDKDGASNATVDLTIEPAIADDGMCHRPDATAIGDIWVDDRGGDNVWVYQESNGVEGLQVGGDQTSPAGHQDGDYVDCANGDTLIF